MFMKKWVSSFTDEIKDASQEFVSFKDSPNLRCHLERAFKAKATTLSSYWYGWHKWLTHCSRASIHPGKPEGSQLADFLFAVSHEHDNRPNSKTVQSAASVLNGMKFAAARGRIPALLSAISSPAVKGYSKPSGPCELKEAPPLPACAAFELEQLMCSDTNILTWHDQLVVGFFLVCVWVGLRFEDAMRCRPDSLSCSGWIIRGCCWDVKPSNQGQPFAFLAFGMSGRAPAWGWGHVWLKSISQ